MGNSSIISGGGNKSGISFYISITTSNKDACGQQ
jgi:hypothetical protein